MSWGTFVFISDEAFNALTNMGVFHIKDFGPRGRLGAHSSVQVSLADRLDIMKRTISGMLSIGLNARSNDETEQANMAECKTRVHNITAAFDEVVPKLRTYANSNGDVMIGCHDIIQEFIDVDLRTWAEELTKAAVDEKGWYDEAPNPDYLAGTVPAPAFTKLWDFIERSHTSLEATLRQAQIGIGTAKRGASGGSGPGGDGKRAKTRQLSTCWDWLQNKCRRTAETCRYLHVEGYGRGTPAGGPRGGNGGRGRADARDRSSVDGAPGRGDGATNNATSGARGRGVTADGNAGVAASQSSALVVHRGGGGASGVGGRTNSSG